MVMLIVVARRQIANIYYTLVFLILNVHCQLSNVQADSAKAASCHSSPRHSILADGNRASSEEADGGVTNTETTQTTPTRNTDNIRPASCTPTNPPRLKQDKFSPDVRTPPRQVSKDSRSKHTRCRTLSANGEKRAKLKKMTRLVGKDGSPSKKTDALLTANFQSLNDMDRVKRVRMASENIIKVPLFIQCTYMASELVPITFYIERPFDTKHTGVSAILVFIKFWQIHLVCLEIKFCLPVHCT